MSEFEATAESGAFGLDTYEEFSGSPHQQELVDRLCLIEHCHLLDVDIAAGVWRVERDGADGAIAYILSWAAQLFPGELAQITDETLPAIDRADLYLLRLLDYLPRLIDYLPRVVDACFPPPDSAPEPPRKRPRTMPPSEGQAGSQEQPTAAPGATPDLSTLLPPPDLSPLSAWADFVFGGLLTADPLDVITRNLDAIPRNDKREHGRPIHRPITETVLKDRIVGLIGLTGYEQISDDEIRKLVRRWNVEDRLPITIRYQKICHPNNLPPSRLTGREARSSTSPASTESPSTFTDEDDFICGGAVSEDSLPLIAVKYSGMFGKSILPTKLNNWIRRLAGTQGDITGLTTHEARVRLRQYQTEGKIVISGRYSGIVLSDDQPAPANLPERLNELEVDKLALLGGAITEDSCQDIARNCLQSTEGSLRLDAIKVGTTIRELCKRLQGNPRDPTHARAMLKSWLKGDLGEPARQAYANVSKARTTGGTETNTDRTAPSIAGYTDEEKLHLGAFLSTDSRRAIAIRLYATEKAGNPTAHVTCRSIDDIDQLLRQFVTDHNIPVSGSPKSLRAGLRERFPQQDRDTATRFYDASPYPAEIDRIPDQAVDALDGHLLWILGGFLKHGAPRIAKSWDAKYSRPTSRQTVDNLVFEMGQALGIYSSSPPDLREKLKDKLTDTAKRKAASAYADTTKADAPTQGRGIISKKARRRRSAKQRNST